MMYVKGTAIKSIPQFVKFYHPDKFANFLDSLSESSKQIMGEVIIINYWYPIYEAYYFPLEAIRTLFFEGDTQKCATNIGRFSAQTALTGIYKIFLKLGSPNHIIQRATKIFSTYFNPAHLVVVDHSHKNCVFRVTEFGKMQEIAEYNILGWCEMALELSGCKNLKIQILSSISSGDPYTEYRASWA